VRKLVLYSCLLSFSHVVNLCKTVSTRIVYVRHVEKKNRAIHDFGTQCAMRDNTSSSVKEQMEKIHSAKNLKDDGTV
jgi:hypothetical protein